jgi:large subunit ribosomal protein L28
MAKCAFTGKRPVAGNRVSHSNRKTRMVQKPNVVTKRFWLEDEERWVKLRLSTRAIRTIDKIGLKKYAKRVGITL